MPKLAVPAIGQFPLVKASLRNLLSQPSRRFLLQLALAALVLCFCTGTVQAGFRYSLSDAPAAGCSAPVPSSNDTPTPTEPPPHFLQNPPQDANTSGAGGSANLVGPSLSGLCALPATTVELNHHQLNGWYSEPSQLQIPSPMPSSIFHPPRG